MLDRCDERAGNLTLQVRPALRLQLANLDGLRMRSQTIDNFVTSSTHRINQPPLYYLSNGSMGTATGPLAGATAEKAVPFPNAACRSKVFLKRRPTKLSRAP
jgi:hypothetical protein